ncbi:MAG: hypothetical protein Tsb005_18850 [Gammaproteobacteria bacterium]
MTDTLISQQYDDLFSNEGFEPSVLEEKVTQLQVMLNQENWEVIKSIHQDLNKTFWPLLYFLKHNSYQKVIVYKKNSTEDKNKKDASVVNDGKPKSIQITMASINGHEFEQLNLRMKLQDSNTKNACPKVIFADPTKRILTNEKNMRRHLHKKLPFLRENNLNNFRNSGKSKEAYYADQFFVCHEFIPGEFWYQEKFSNNQISVADHIKKITHTLCKKQVNLTNIDILIIGTTDYFYVLPYAWELQKFYDALSEIKIAPQLQACEIYVVGRTFSADVICNKIN